MTTFDNNNLARHERSQHLIVTTAGERPRFKG